MKVSISLGGSLLTRNRSLETYRANAEALGEVKEKGHQLVVVCGGGRPAREFVTVACELNADPHL